MLLATKKSKRFQYAFVFTLKKIVAKNENGSISLTPDGKYYRLYFKRNRGCRNLGGIRKKR